MKKAIFLASMLLTTAAHASCFVMGDSIAQGIAAQMPVCASSNTKVGLNTRDAIAKFQDTPKADAIVVSLGINDDPHQPTEANLRAIRSRLSASQVIWVLPSHADKKAAVQRVAGQFHDQTINIDRYISPVDGIHPTTPSYKTIANQLTAYLKS